MGPFARRLQEQLVELHRLLDRPGFGAGPMSVGAEVEVSLVGPDGASSPINHEILGTHLDPRVVVELDRFNLEFNATPVGFQGQPFAALGAELERGLASMANAAAVHDARVVPVGILPTLTLDDLQSSAMSEVHRYRALSAALRQQKRGPFQVSIDGDDPLEVECDDVTLEGAATSFQIHLRVEARDFADVYNAAQLATPVVLAVSGNSPIFLGRRLWDETRIALFKQAVDGRSLDGIRSFPPPRVWFGNGWVRDGAYELFAANVALYAPLLPTLFDAQVERGAAPALRELRLHNSTVWRWNRPVYDPEYGGHLRIEFRALPSGPTVTDMMANAAFMIGLTLGLAPRIRDLLPGLPFEFARHNFYRAAQKGLDAELLWPGAPPSPHLHNAAELATELLSIAEDGLSSVGIASADIDDHLAIIRDRIAADQTGARWQRRAFEHFLGHHDRQEAARRMLESYFDGLRGGEPVHQWPLP